MAAAALTLAECCASILPYSGGACEAVELAYGGGGSGSFDGGGGSGPAEQSAIVGVGGLCGGGDSGSDKPAADADGGVAVVTGFGRARALRRRSLVDPLTGPQRAIVARRPRRRRPGASWPIP